MIVRYVLVVCVSSLKCPPLLNQTKILKLTRLNAASAPRTSSSSEARRCVPYRDKEATPKISVLAVCLLKGQTRRVSLPGPARLSTEELSRHAGLPVRRDAHQPEVRHHRRALHRGGRPSQGSRTGAGEGEGKGKGKGKGGKRAAIFGERDHCLPQVVLGEFDVGGDPDCEDCRPVQRLPVNPRRDVTVHPEWDGSDPLAGADIALIRMSRLARTIFQDINEVDRWGKNSSPPVAPLMLMH